MAADFVAPPVIAPYITAWSAEIDLPCTVVEVPGRGIGYADESLTDRDRSGVLWARTSWALGEGRPAFGRVHSARQRQAMRRLLCQVCGGPADRTDAGVLWLLRDHRDDWPGWPGGMGVTEPPVCRACVHLSAQLCPALRKGAVALRAKRFPVVGVRGTLYAGGPTAVEDAIVTLDDPAIRWVRAVNLVRELADCALVEVSDVIS